MTLLILDGKYLIEIFDKELELWILHDICDFTNYELKVDTRFETTKILSRYIIEIQNLSTRKNRIFTFQDDFNRFRLTHY